MNMPRVVLSLLLIGLVGGCAPKVGTEAWCKALDAKAKGDWTAHEVADYAKHCVLGLEPKH